MPLCLPVGLASYIHVFKPQWDDWAGVSNSYRTVTELYSLGIGDKVPTKNPGCSCAGQAMQPMFAPEPIECMVSVLCPSPLAFSCWQTRFVSTPVGSTCCSHLPVRVGVCCGACRCCGTDSGVLARALRPGPTAALHSRSSSCRCTRADQMEVHSAGVCTAPKSRPIIRMASDPT